MSFDTYADPASEARLRTAQERFTPERRSSRTLWTELAVAAAFLLVATLIALLAPDGRPLSATALGVVALLTVAVVQVTFPVGSVYTWPAALAFVPAVFFLPLRDVPLIEAGLALLALSPQLLRGHPVDQILAKGVSRIGDCWYAIGPVAVLLSSTDQRLSWSLWPIYLAAFGSQVILDIGSGLTRSWFSEGILACDRRQMLWVYLTDGALSCLGLEAAVCAMGSPGMLLLELPLLGLLGLFAQERHARMNGSRELSSAYRGTAMLLGDVIEGDDEYTGAHSRAVVELSVALADRLGLDPSRRQLVEFGALLHDVGKIRVPKTILNKPGKLDSSEWAIMCQHTVYGEEMLSRVGGALGRVGGVVRHSHERWDGAGYPDRIAGPEIPMESRIISACDAYNAMTTDRPYRHAMEPADAFAEMTRCAGSQFDPAVVDALLSELAAPRPDDRPAPRSTDRPIPRISTPVGTVRRRRRPARLVGPAGVAQSVRAAES